jgi:hypothetical protein
MQRPSRIALPRLSVLHVLVLAVISGVLTACATGGASFVPPSRPAQFSMTGIPWGIAGDSVQEHLEPRGYNFNKIDEDGDLWFDGMLFRTPTRVFAFMADQKLVKLRTLIITEDTAAVAMYRTARAELVKQFGTPKETVEEYQAPYKKGDQKQLEAIRSGKGNVRTYWLPPASSRLTLVSVELTDKLVVAVDYESRAWDRESVRRRQQR